MEGQTRFLLNDFASEEEKSTKEFAVQTIRNFWVKFNNNGFFNSRALNFRNIRAWAQGLESVQELIDQTTTRIEGGEPNSSWINLDYSSPSILANYIDGIVGDMISWKYKVKCNATDKTSSSKKLEAKQREYNKLRFGKELQIIEEISGIPAERSKYESEEEIDVDFDNYKLSLEEAVEVTIQNILEMCKTEDIQRKLFYDFINLDMAVVRCYYDINYYSKIEYIDPEMYVNSFSLLEDFSDVNIEGHVEYITIGEFKRRTNADDETLYDIACKFAGQLGNSQTLGVFQPNIANTQYSWYSNLIMVLNFEFLTIDTSNYKIKPNKYGKKRIYKDEPSDKYENISKRIQNAYEGLWVVGSDYVFNYKKKENMIRKRLDDGTFDTQTQTGYFKFAPNIRYGVNKSITERAIPFAKQCHLAILKIQQFMLKAKPPGYRININGLNGVDLGNGKTEFDPLSMQIFHEQTGVLVYDSDGEGGIPANNRPPIEALIIPIGEIEKLMSNYAFNLEQIRQVCGRPVGVDSSTPNPDTLVGVMNASKRAAMVTLEPIRRGFTNIMKNAINYLCMMVQDKCTDMYGRAVGDVNIALLEMSSDVELATLGMDLEFEPDDLEKQEMKVTLDYEVKSGNLLAEDAMYILTLPNIKSMRRVMMVRRERYKKKRLEESQANIKLQSQTNAEAAIAAERQRQETEVAIIEAKKQLAWTEAAAKVWSEQMLLPTEQQKAETAHIHKLAETYLSNSQKTPQNAGQPI